MGQKTTIRLCSLALLLAGAAFQQTAYAQAMPAPAPTCAVTPDMFKAWQDTSYGGGLNFKPANSASFNDATNCDFYQWGAQMFLWLTSRDRSGNLVIFSPNFYTASEKPDGTFAFTKNAEGVSASANKAKKPSLFKVRVNKPKEAPEEVVEKVKAKLKAGSKGAALTTPTADSTAQAGGSGVLVLNGAPVPVANKAGYATYPIVYYTIQVNDVFAGLAQNQAKVKYYNDTTNPNAGNFPITLDQVNDIAKASGTTYSDAEQLAMEVKSSWVDVTYLTAEQKAGLQTIEADVPAFKSGSTNGLVTLTSDGTVTATRTLALVGMHVVGTVKDHPEMVWATFESKFNAPDADFNYLNTNYNITTSACNSGTDCISTVPLSTSTQSSYIFYNGNPGAAVAPSAITQTATSGSDAKGNMVITFTSSTSVPAAGSPPQLTPTSVVRLNPWGSLQSTTPQVSDFAVVNNTLLMSLQASLEPQLVSAGGPVYANYFQGGSIWAKGPIPFKPGYVEKGTQYLANSTMETFEQYSLGSLTQASASQPTTNCFTCHGLYGSGTNYPNGTSVSHIFPDK
ncbi:hypothetical protein [Allorhizobium terrae]|uniref:Cytochrome c family protein n=1 Tax=Allorhizobium terrae TaxID=1848972 RepID=A0A4S3ZRW7_9HYPH|nr:hypothetical protein [Allorhizobium terrae]THF48343.1 hypothetical protein E6C51_15700 [Allorhizobium terrae]